jgi:diadenosine tetraphosphatase ApaH/serine/threonine PP2A family protein phosphatase
LRSQLVVVETQDFSKVAVVGDLHGDYRTLQNLLKIVDLKADLLVFLGDYADRGPDGVEVIRTVADLQKNHSENVVALKGNHEDFTENGEPNFNPCTLVYEAEVKKGNWSHYFLEELKPFIDSLSLCCLISGNALLLHGGISGKLKGLEDLREPSDELMMDLLWSDPKDGDGEEPNYSRGIGVEFGPDVSAAVCDSLGVKRIIRSHQPQMASTKPHIMHDGRVITVNTTSVYGGHPFIYFIDPKSTKKDYYQVI